MPEIEEKVLKFWKEHRIFEKSLELRKKAKPFRFFEGPPTANGRPHMGHVQGRVFKDIVPRFKSMQGYFVERKAGWDTHGLPVEIEVEKELGLKNKQEIEKFGIAEFNERAKASVLKYKEEWERMTDRIGFWMDLEHPYITYHPKYIESLWWVFGEINKRKLLARSFKIVPWCPRCQTPLSSHEVSQGYKKVGDPSVFIKFEIKRAKLKIAARKGYKEYFLVWTTTPWTLPANVAIAVNPKLTYTKYKVGNEFLWSYVPPPSAADVEVVEKISGKKLIGIEYEPLFNVSGPWRSNKKFFKVYGADFVGTEEGSGLVHIAPAFGEDDLNLIKKIIKQSSGQIPVTIDDKGIVQKGLPGAGKFVKQADKDIIDDLKKRNLLYQSGLTEHEYPFCWRCDTPLLYIARHSWFIEMSKLRDELLKNNQKINWMPAHMKEGRFGEWLKDIKDWAISRERYWGTPLPIWQCDKCGKIEVVGSLRDLDKFCYSKNNFYLLRHREAEHNLKNVIASGPERGGNVSKLTEKGINQAEAAGKRFFRKLGKKKLDVIFVSPYYRAKQTAEIISKIVGARIVVDERLKEIDCGNFNWLPEEEYQIFFPDVAEKFVKAPPGGENLNDVKKRVFEFIRDINSKYENKNILVVSHGDPLWMLEGAMAGLSNEEMLKMEYIKVDGDVKPVEMHNWPRNERGELDLHRPYVDSVYLLCGKCKGRMARVKEVADVWFDSGAMPYAQWHYPFENKVLIEKNVMFPADYISEGIDQTRGWFYTLLAVSTLLKKGAPYLNVIAQGHILDKFGKKMSKSKGNVVDPLDLIKKYGADTLRWYFYTQTVPGESKAFDEMDLEKILRKFIMIIYNSFVFWNTYADKHQQSNQILKSEYILDRWILSRLDELISEVTENLEKYEIGLAGKALDIFVDDLSRWYIRRSRSRLQRPANKKELVEASDTLFYCLLELSKLIAPFTPFFADALYLSLRGTVPIERRNAQINFERSLASDRRKWASVHLEDWPEAGGKSVDYSLSEKMAEVRRISSLALALRAEKGVKVRQPLQVLEIRNKKLSAAADVELLEILKDEVNVKEIRWNFDLAEELALDFAITPELKEEGLLREAIRMVQGLRRDADYVPADIIALMIEGSKTTVAVLTRRLERFKKDVGAKNVDFKKSAKFDAELNSKIDDEPIWIGVRKI